MEKLNKRDLVELVAEKAHLSKKDAEEAIDVTFSLMEKALLSGKEVNITNFGVLVPKMKGERIGTDPKTHEHITIKAKNSVIFRLSKTLKSKMNK
ncbi:MAG: HU family DNA-binding protein [Bacilli bacterium]|nr:HU family DNA-binding protein [Bacilli bacterium]